MKSEAGFSHYPTQKPTVWFLNAKISMRHFTVLTPYVAFSDTPAHRQASPETERRSAISANHIWFIWLGSGNQKTEHIPFFACSYPSTVKILFEFANSLAELLSVVAPPISPEIWLPPPGRNGVRKCHCLVITIFYCSVPCRALHLSLSMQCPQRTQRKQTVTSALIPPTS